MDSFKVFILIPISIDFLLFVELGLASNLVHRHFEDLESAVLTEFVKPLRWPESKWIWLTTVRNPPLRGPMAISFWSQRRVPRSIHGFSVKPCSKCPIIRGFTPVMSLKPPKLIKVCEVHLYICPVSKSKHASFARFTHPFIDGRSDPL